MTKFWVGTAGVILAVFLVGCWPSVYRLDGTAPVRQVALLDSAAKQSVDSVRVEFQHMLAMVAKSEIAAIDSMNKSASSLGPAIRQAERKLRDARASYKTTFQKMAQFRSFGGNPVFSDDDVNVSTKKLLTEIAERFYKGRAFSLETEGQIRKFIRQELVHREAEVNQARSRVVRLKRSQKGRSEATTEIEAQTREKRNQLLKATNKEIQDVIWQHHLLLSEVDQNDRFSFEGIAPGAYYLSSGIRDSISFIVPVSIDAHTHTKLSQGNGFVVAVDLSPEAENE